MALCWGCSPSRKGPSGNSQNPAARGKKQVSSLAAQTNPDPSGRPDLTGLPLIEVNSSSVRFGYMAFLITGDGGWEAADLALARSFAASGVPVVALDWPRYCASRPTPEEAAASLAKILTYYFSTWNQDKVVVMGLSLGAEALAFMLNRLPDSLMSHVEVVALLEPGSRTRPELSIIDWLGRGNKTSSLPIRSEIEKLRAKTIYCFHGTQPASALCRSLDPKRVLVRALKSGNSRDVPYDAAAQEIVRKIH